TPSPEPSPSATPVATEVPDASPILRPTEPLWPAAGGRGGRADRKPPSRPKDLLSAALETGSYLWWDSASDDRGVVGYAIWRDGRRIGRTRSTSFEDLKGRGSRHVYAVRAFDAAGNRSKAAVLRVRTVRNASTLARTCLVPSRVYRTC
ncbi:MAG TPA: hypothetical protein VEV43_02150, partial [Actinomycetota bacterium]|nr:hypothetical protein [Actinomycetota bacterium]